MTNEHISGDVLESHYLHYLVLTPRDKLWVIVQEARDYLTAWLTTPSGKLHPAYGKIMFNSDAWGNIVEDGGSCEVSLEGLWYLQKGYGLLGDVRKPLLIDFLNEFTSPEYNASKIHDLLGVTVPEGLTDELVPHDEWDTCHTRPEHMLLFLHWLLGKRLP